MKDRKQRLAELFGPAINDNTGRRAHQTFSRAQIIMMMSVVLLLFVAVESVEVYLSTSARAAIEQAAIDRACPPIRMPVRYSDISNRLQEAQK